MPATTLAYDLAEAPAAGAGAAATGVAAAAGVEAAFAARALGGRYQLVRELGRGATGVVLLARDRLLHRAVALKVLHLELARSAAARERFRREARILAQLPAHPGVVPCLGYDEVPLPGGSVACCLAMPYLAGDTLADRVAARGRCRGPRRPRCSPRSPTRSRTRTRTASCTATSSPRTCSSPAGRPAR
jgi:serine/threonine-protein kinase